GGPAGGEDDPRDLRERLGDHSLRVVPPRLPAPYTPVSARCGRGRGCFYYCRAGIAGPRATSQLICSFDHALCAGRSTTPAVIQAGDGRQWIRAGVSTASSPSTPRPAHG